MTSKVDLVIQYALAVAGEADEFRDRELGPIHLIKYVYLADLAHAVRSGGETFTNTPWLFYKFGPFAQAVNARVGPAARAIEARDRAFESSFSDDDVRRFSLRNNDVLARLERELPIHVSRAVRNAVRKFGNDTYGLLHHVYTTKPMLSAAPNEILSFKQRDEDTHFSETAPKAQRSVRQQKRRDEEMERVKARIRERLKSQPQHTADVEGSSPSPRYDERFEEICRLLAEDDGAPMQEERGELVIDGSVWKSPGRSMPDA